MFKFVEIGVVFVSLFEFNIFLVWGINIVRYGKNEVCEVEKKEININD